MKISTHSFKYHDFDIEVTGIRDGVMNMIAQPCARCGCIWGTREAHEECLPLVEVIDV